MRRVPCGPPQPPDDRARAGSGGPERTASRSAVRRSLWVVIDQGLTSLTNFAVTAVVARSVDTEAFGAFGLAFVTYLVSLNLSRALVSQPLVLRSSAQPDERAELPAAAGAALAVGVTLAVVVLAAGVAVGGQPGRVLVVLAVFLPGLVLQDAWRFAFFATARPRLAVVNDLTCAVIQVGFMAGVLVLAEGTAATLTAAWGGAALVAAVVAGRQARAHPTRTGSWAFLRRHGDLGGRLGVESLLESGTMQITTLCLAFVVGSAGVGAIRGAQTLFGPFTTLAIGLVAATIPEGSRLFARRPTRLRPLLQAMSVSLCVAGACWGLALGLLPDAWGRAVLGETWPAARGLLPPLTMMMAGIGFLSGGMVALRVLTAASASLRLRLVTGPISLAAGVTGGAVAGAQGGAWGLAIGAWITGLGAWWTAGTRLRSIGDGAGSR